MIYEQMDQKQLIEELEKIRTNNIIRVGEIEIQQLEIKLLENKIKDIKKHINILSSNNVNSNHVISELKMCLRNSIK